MDVSICVLPKQLINFFCISAYRMDVFFFVSLFFFCKSLSFQSIYMLLAMLKDHPTERWLFTAQFCQNTKLFKNKIKDKIQGYVG